MPFLCAVNCKIDCHFVSAFQIDLTSSGVHQDLFDPSICDLLLDTPNNDKDVFESGDWTYLEAVPPFQTFMKPEEDQIHLPDLMVSERMV